MQVSQKQAARTAEQGRNHVHRSSQPFQSRASPLQPVQQQQQRQQHQQQPQWVRSGDAKQDDGANDDRQQTQHMQQPPAAQYAQRAWPQRDDNSMMASSKNVADGQAPPANGKGLKVSGGEGVAAVLASDVPAAYQGRQAQQVKLSICILDGISYSLSGHVMFSGRLDKTFCKRKQEPDTALLHLSLVTAGKVIINSAANQLC